MTTTPKHPLHIVLSIHDGSDGCTASPWHEAEIEQYALRPDSLHGYDWSVYRYQPAAGEFELIDTFVDIEDAVIGAAREAADMGGVSTVWVGPGRDEACGFELQFDGLKVLRVSDETAGAAAVRTGYSVATEGAA